MPLRRDRPVLRLPLASSTVAAGFPSPTDDSIDVGIQHGNLLVVDRSLEPRPGPIEVAVLDGAFTLKRLEAPPRSYTAGAPWLVLRGVAQQLGIGMGKPYFQIGQHEPAADEQP